MKGVAVPYIIAILLGVGVIGLIGYWLFVSGGQFGGSAATTGCRSAQLNYCNQKINNLNPPWDQSAAGTGCTKPDTENKICESYGVKISSSGVPAVGVSGCDERVKPPSCPSPPGGEVKCVNGQWVKTC